MTDLMEMTEEERIALPAVEWVDEDTSGALPVTEVSW